MLKFLNFKRDYSCSAAEFMMVFRQNFKIEADKLEDWQVLFLMQHYSVDIVKDADQLAKEGGKQETKRKYNSNDNKKVQLFDFVKDIGMRNKGVDFSDIPLTYAAERMVKAIILQEPNESPSFSRLMNERYGDRYNQTLTMSRF